MRFILSAVTGLAVLGGVFAAGGASLTVSDAPPPVSVALATPLGIEAPFTAVIDPGAVRGVQAPTTTTPPTREIELPDPDADQPLNEWFGCAPPVSGSVCILRETGIGALVPDEPADLEDWRPLVEVFFEDHDVERALDVIWCESNGDRWAKNPTSTASGLFQHLASLWAPRAQAAGYGGADVFDPEANVATAAWLVYEAGGWSHWYPSEGCWG